MNKRRLLKLADLLEADAKNKKGVKFDLREWAQVEEVDGYVTTYGFKRNAKPELSCNTHACAVGLAAISGAFKRQGLTYGFRGGRLIPVFGRTYEWNAIKKFFDIKMEAAHMLFLARFYNESRGAKAELAVAKRIRDFVAGKPIAETT